MVCSMYEEAASLASSAIDRALNLAAEDSSLYDMTESAGMVLVQSMREMGRSSNFSRMVVFFIKMKL